MTQKVLLIGFGPFLSYTTNPSGDIAKSLNGKKIGDAEIVGRVLQVGHKLSAVQLHEYVVSEKPDVLLGIGIRALIGTIALENIAVNTFLFRDKEEEFNEPLYEEGKESYYSTLPLEAIKGALESNGIPADYSFSADTYISNEVFYEIMKSAEKYEIKRAGFIHLPLSHQQIIDRLHIHYLTRLGAPSMSYDTLENAVKIAITEAVKDSVE